MSLPSDSGSFLFRDVKPSDKAQVLEFTANTWEFGDYIEHVFDDWLNDPAGRFLAAEDKLSGRVAAIDKLSLLSPTEAWFEGLRVNPAFRGRGLAASLQKYMIGEAHRLGARTTRFLTNITNEPVHRMGYRDGFTMQLVVSFWKWLYKERPNDGQQELESLQEAVRGIDLRRASSDEAPALFEWWRRSSAYQTNGLMHENWSYRSATADVWADRAAEGLLLVAQHSESDSLTLPPPSVLLRNGKSDTGDRAWVISAVTALGATWELLMRGLTQYALGQAITEVNGLLPDTTRICASLERAGFVGEGADERLCVFALQHSSAAERPSP